MKRSLPSRWFLAAWAVLTGVSLYAATEAELIDNLGSAAGVPEKCATCRELRRVGTAKAVPALAGLLGDDRVGHAARYALEGIPGPEAGAALRAALGRTSGFARVGVIDSLGWRGEAKAVSLLAPLLADADPVTAAASATALGRIGGKSALKALSARRDTAPAAVQPAVLEALLRAAEKHVAEDPSAAAKVFGGLVDGKFSPEVRTAAWRGLFLAEPAKRTERFISALAGSDRPVQLAALKLLREAAERPQVEAVVKLWDSLPPESQLAVLDAHVKLGAEALPTVRKASASPHLALRLAAWRAFGELNDPDSLLALAKASATAKSPEREAARETLTRLHGPGVREAFLARLREADAVAKPELLRALGDRGEPQVAPVLLDNAADGAEPVRLAALEALTTLAAPDSLAPLLALAAKPQPEACYQALMRAMFAVCQASPNKEQAAGLVIGHIKRSAPDARRQALPLLGEFGTPAALEVVLEATRDTDAGIVKEALGVLAQWPNAAPAARLLELGRTNPDAVLQALALRGCIQVLDQEPDQAKRLAMLQQAMDAAKRPEEKRQALGQMGRIPTAPALAAILPSLADPALINEAGLAAVTVAEAVAPANGALATEAAAKLLGASQNPEVLRRAWALRGKTAQPGPFIQEWQICGPYRQANVTGAKAVFDLVYGPEKPGEAVNWQPVPKGNDVNLAGLFPNQDNCIAYLRTRVIVPEATPAVLLMGSDDGVKAWLNGTAVLANNVDRGMVADQDAAPIQLAKGANELLVKVTQGGGGWSLCARIVGVDGKPLTGLTAAP